jgi:hypothetical protein
LKGRIDAVGSRQKTTIEIWMADTVPLYRPVGPEELQLIAESGFSRFPPRLPDQPIFYPVCNFEYAAEIASKWNVRDSGRGYVTFFEVDKAYLSRYDVQQVGSKRHEEYWIPADELPEFAAHIVGNIQVLRSFPKFEGDA